MASPEAVAIKQEEARQRQAEALEKIEGRLARIEHLLTAGPADPADVFDLEGAIASIVGRMEAVEAKLDALRPKGGR